MPGGNGGRSPCGTAEGEEGAGTGRSTGNCHWWHRQCCSSSGGWSSNRPPTPPRGVAAGGRLTVWGLRPWGGLGRRWWWLLRRFGGRLRREGGAQYIHAAGGAGLLPLEP